MSPAAVPSDASSRSDDVASPPKPARSFGLRTVLLALGQLSSALLGIVTLAVLVRRLPTDEYASYRQALLLTGTALPVLAWGLPEALYYFLPREKERARGVVFENLLLLGLSAIGFGAILLAVTRFTGLGELGIPANANTWGAAALYICAALPLMATTPAMVSLERPTYAAVLAASTRFASLLFVVAATWLSPTGATAMLALAGGSFLSLGLSVAAVLQVTRGARFEVRPSRALEQLRYALPLGLAAGINTIGASADKWVVSALSSAADFAVYATGAIEVPFIGIITGSAVATALPMMHAAWQRGDRALALSHWREASAFSARVILPLGVFLFLVADDFIAFLFSEAYRSSASIFRIYLLLLPVRTIFFGPALVVAGRKRLVVVTGLAAALASGALAAGFSIGIGTTGAAFGFVLGILLFQVLPNLALIARAYSTSVFHTLPLGQYARIVGCSLLALLPATAVYLAVPPPPLLRLAASGVAFAIALAVAYERTGVMAFSQALRRFSARLGLVR